MKEIPLGDILFIENVSISSDSTLPLWPVGVFNLWQKLFNHIKGNITHILMHSCIVNGYKLLCDTHIVLEPHRGTADFLYFIHYCPFPLFLFMCLSL